MPLGSAGLMAYVYGVLPPLALTGLKDGHGKLAVPSLLATLTLTVNGGLATVTAIVALTPAALAVITALPVATGCTLAVVGPVEVTLAIEALDDCQLTCASTLPPAEVRGEAVTVTGGSAGLEKVMT